VPPVVRVFANGALEHMARYGSSQTQFAKIAHKNYRNAAKNPYAQFRK
jgi:acetyl-CoA acetyltransferase